MSYMLALMMLMNCTCATRPSRWRRFRHTRDLKAPLSPEPQDFAKEGGGGCRRGCVLCVGLLFTLLLVVALAAGVLALAIIFTGFVDSPLCSCATGEGGRGGREGG